MHDDETVNTELTKAAFRRQHSGRIADTHDYVSFQTLKMFPTYHSALLEIERLNDELHSMHLKYNGALLDLNKARLGLSDEDGI